MRGLHQKIATHDSFTLRHLSLYLNRYLENGACATLTDIYESRIDTYTGENKGPVYPFDETTGGITNNVTGSWYLESSLYVTEGARLVVQGESSRVLRKRNGNFNSLAQVE